MTKHALSRLFFISLALLCACKKDNDRPKYPEDNVPQYQLRSITWNNGLKGEFVYNSESNLQHIDYTFNNVSDRTVFGWNGKAFTEMYDDGSLYKNVYEYDADGKVIKMRNIARSGSLPTEYRFEYHYNTAKQIDTLRYIVVNEAGTQSKWISGYEYSSTGDLLKVTTRYDSTVITHTIDTYSPSVSFVPCHYIETTMSENYVIYNLGIMMQLQKQHKLPSKVTRVVKTGSNPSYVDKIEERLFIVNNYRIDKLYTTITSPGMPGYVNKLEAVYSYN
jgi:hypothetical protein